MPPDDATSRPPKVVAVPADAWSARTTIGERLGHAMARSITNGTSRGAGVSVPDHDRDRARRRDGEVDHDRDRRRTRVGSVGQSFGRRPPGLREAFSARGATFPGPRRGPDFAKASSGRHKVPGPADQDPSVPRLVGCGRSGPWSSPGGRLDGAVEVGRRQSRAEERHAIARRGPRNTNPYQAKRTMPAWPLRGDPVSASRMLGRQPIQAALRVSRALAHRSGLWRTSASRFPTHQETRVWTPRALAAFQRSRHRCRACASSNE